MSPALPLPPLCFTVARFPGSLVMGLPHQPPSHTSNTVWVCPPCSNIPSCVTLGELLSPSLPHFPIFKGMLGVPFLKLVMRI